MNAVVFDFHGDNGTVQPVTVPNCPDNLRDALTAAAAGVDGNGVFTIADCVPEGAVPGSYLFRASRVHNVRVQP